MSSDFACQVTATHSGVADDSASPSQGVVRVKMAVNLSLLIKVAAGSPRKQASHFAIGGCCSSVLPLYQRSVAAVPKTWCEQMRVTGIRLGSKLAI